MPPPRDLDVWPPSRARTLLPFVALAVLVATLAICLHLGAAKPLWKYDLPVISSLGERMPERGWFVGGFSLLAALMALLFLTRARMLAREPRVERSLGLRARVHACSLLAALSVATLLVMAWIPDHVSPIHFFAALATFGTLALYQLAHASICSALTRPGEVPGPRGPGPWVRAWLFVCPFAALGCVAHWIVGRSVPAQYAAVALQFAYFLPLSPAFGEPSAPARAEERG